MNLIDLIIEHFAETSETWKKPSGAFSYATKVYTLGPDRLKLIQPKLALCAEFQNIQLKIVNRPSQDLNTKLEERQYIDEKWCVKTLKFDKKTNFTIQNGIYYLYQINTLDFKTFDIRGEFKEDYNTAFMIDGLTTGQSLRLKNSYNKNYISGGNAKESMTYILKVIEDYRIENAAQDYIAKLVEEEIKAIKCVEAKRSDIINNMDGKEYISFDDNGNPYLEKHDGTKIKLNMEQKKNEIMDSVNNTIDASNLFVSNPFGRVLKEAADNENVNILLNSIESSFTYTEFLKKTGMSINRDQFKAMEPAIENWRLSGMNETFYAYLASLSGEKLNNAILHIETKPAEIMYQEIKAKNPSALDEMINNVKKQEPAAKGFNTIEEVAEHQSKMFKDFDNLLKNSKSTLANNEEKDSYSALVNEISTIERTLNECEGLEDEQIIALKDRIKNFESKLKDKIKPKTITISSAVHNKIKKYCNMFNLKIGDWVEDTLLKALDCTDDKAYSVDEMRIQETADITKNYFASKKINKLLKADRLVLLPKFRFKGYSHVDFKPLYDYIGSEKEFTEDIKKVYCNIQVVPDNKEVYTPNYLPEFAEMLVEGFDINCEDEEDIDLEKITSEGFKKLINMLKGKK